MLFIASDHAAFEEKEDLKNFLEEKGLGVEDLGTYSQKSCDYPDLAINLAKKIQEKVDSKGILLCGSGIGVSLAANRFAGVRAARCLSLYDAEMSRRHNDANVICLGARITSKEDLKGITVKWLETSFEGGRHQKRVDIFNQLGEK